MYPTPNTTYDRAGGDMKTLVRHMMARKLLFGCLMVLLVPVAWAQPLTTEGLLQEARNVIESKNSVIENQKEEIESLESENSEQAGLVNQLESKIRELEVQIAAHKQVVALKDELIAVHKDQIAIHTKAIEARDEAIKQLAQPRKTAVWQKVAESLVPVASIIALAAVNGN
jgi:septal ring factor EnvC (AmiA/AmiB activator)